MIKLIRRRGSVNNTTIDLCDCELSCMPYKREARKIITMHFGHQYLSISNADIYDNDGKLRYDNIYFIDTLNTNNYIYVYSKETGKLVAVKVMLYINYYPDPSVYVVCNQSVLTDDGNLTTDFDRIKQTTCLEKYDRNLEGIYYRSEYYDFPIRYEYHNKLDLDSNKAKENFDKIYRDAEEYRLRLKVMDEILELNKDRSFSII